MKQALEEEQNRTHHPLKYTM